jgi:hypothetical protein
LTILRHTHRHPEEPRSSAASRRMAASACGSSFEARPRGRAPQDDGSFPPIVNEFLARNSGQYSSDLVNH